MLQETKNIKNGQQEALDVTVDHVSVDFGSTRVITDVSFQVKKGETFVIMGPSGSGKSVLLRTMVGLIEPTMGSVHFGEYNAHEKKTKELVKTAMVFQAGALFNSQTVYDNLAFYPREHRLATEDEIRQKVERALEMLSLKDAINKIPAELSGGMRKRVSIARALVMEPQVILYDEPTSELDPIMAATISEIIAALKDELHVTSVVVSHDRELAENISDHMILMRKGKVLAAGTASDVMSDSSTEIQEFFRPEFNLEKPRFREKTTT